ncbi:MAG: nitrous oxide reductase family maturation protein NosD [Acidobacteriota bacterium]
MADLIGPALMVVVMAAPSAVAAHTTIVHPGELTGAIASARPGDTLHLLPGTHAGAFTLAVPLHLVGEPGAVVEGPGHGTVVVVSASGSTLEGLTLRGSGADLAADDAVVRLHEVRDVHVQHCRVDARAFGIYVRAGASNVVTDNEVHGDAGLPVARRGNGIHLWHTHDNEIRDNLLADVRDGVYLSFAHENRIVGNRGTGLRYGIHYMYSERNLLRANRFDRCTGGIALMFSMRNQIEANETLGNRDFGILCQQLEHSTLAGNRTSHNGRGLYLENSAGNRLIDNLIIGNGVGAFLTAGSEDNVFTSNHFDGNLVQVYQDRARGNRWWEKGRGNAWSDYAGFDWNGDGIGETPYRLQTAASALLARRPVARWFVGSPALSLLDWWDTQMSSVDGGTTTMDRFPLVPGPTP